MSSIINTDFCTECGEEFWYDFDCNTLAYTKLAMCKCDRKMRDAEEFLKEKGLLEEFERYHAEREAELEAEREEEEDTE